MKKATTSPKKPVVFEHTRKKAIKWLSHIYPDISDVGMTHTKLATLLMEATKTEFDRKVLGSNYIINEIVSNLPAIIPTKTVVKAPARSVVVKPDIPLTTKELYNEFLKSSVWQGIRSKVLEHARNRCQVCNSKKNLHVHHRTYRNKWGKEDLRDLTVLCEDCHHLFHKHTVAKITSIEEPNKSWYTIVYQNNNTENIQLTKEEIKMLQKSALVKSIALVL